MERTSPNRIRIDGCNAVVLEAEQVNEQLILAEGLAERAEVVADLKLWPTFSTRQASLIFYLRFICLMTAIPFAIFYLAHRLLRLGQFLRPKRVRPQVSRRPSKILPRYGIFRIRIKKRTLPRFPPSLFIYVIILCSITYLNIFITRALPPLTTHTRTLLFSL